MFLEYLNVCGGRLGRYFVVLMGVLDVLRVFWVFREFRVLWSVLGVF